MTREIALTSRLKLVADGLNWKLMEHRTVAGKDGDRDEWKHTGKYFSSLESALYAAYQNELLGGNDDKDLKAAMAEARTIASELLYGKA